MITRRVELERFSVISSKRFKMATLLAPYGSAEAVAVARELDAKIANLLQRVAAPAENTN